MATLTSIRCANVTPNSRRQVITSMVPLQPGQVSGSGTKVWTARDAVKDGETRSDVAVQATQEGPSYADGSWRMARAHFPAELDAATTSYRHYPLWAEHEFPIDTDPGTLPTHTVDATTALGLSGLTFTLRARGAPLVRDPNNNNRPYRNPGTFQEHTVTFTPDAGAIPDYHAPYTVSNPAKSEQDDTSGLSETWIRAYRVSGRILPEASGGSVTEPSLVATLYYEVASEASGMGRFCRFWLEVCNSLCTDDADPRDDATVEYELKQDISLDVTCFTTDVRVAIDASAGYTQRPPVTITGGQRVSVYEHDPWPGRNDWVFPHLMGAHVRGYFWFPGSMDATQRQTRNAIQYQQGDQAFVEGVATTWSETSDVYGAFGVVHKPEDVYHASLSDWRDQVASECVNQLGRMRESNRGGQYNFFPSYTQFPATNGSSATPAFGASLLGMYAGTAHPDLRAVYLSAKIDVQRPMNARNNDGDVFDCSAELTRPSGLADGADSAVMMYDGQPWWLDFGQQRYGKGPALEALNNGSGGLPRALDGGSHGNVSAYDNLHAEYGCPIFYAFLSADRYFLDRFCPSLKETALATLPTPLDYTDYDLGAGIEWNNSGTTSNGVPRGMGRPIKMKAHLYALLGGSDLATNIAERIAVLYDIGKLGSPPDGQPAGLDLSVAHVLRDNSIFFNGYQQVNGACGGGSQVWSDPGRTSWIPWQQALLCEGIYACYRMLVLSGSHSTEAAEALEMAQKLGKAILLYGYRPVGGGDWNSINGFDLLHNPSSLGDPPDWPWEPTQRYCNSGTKFLDDPYGPLNPDRNNVPYYRWNGGSYVFTTLPGSLIGAYLNPSDSDVQAAISTKLTTGNIRGSDAEIRSGASVAAFPSGWHQIASVIPQPFTRWVSGPVTYQASATIEISPISINATATATRVHQASATIAINPFDVTATANRIDPVYQASATIEINPFAGLTATPAFSKVQQASATIAISPFANISASYSVRADAVGGGTVDVEGEGDGGGGGDTPSTPQKETLRDALGPNLARANSVKLVSGPGGPMRITMPRSYKGRIRRDFL